MKNIFKTAILLIGFSGFAQNEADLPDDNNLLGDYTYLKPLSIKDNEEVKLWRTQSNDWILLN